VHLTGSWDANTSDSFHGWGFLLASPPCANSVKRLWGRSVSACSTADREPVLASPTQPSVLTVSRSLENNLGCRKDLEGGHSTPEQEVWDDNFPTLPSFQTKSGWTFPAHTCPRWALRVHYLFFPKLLTCVAGDGAGEDSSKTLPRGQVRKMA